MWKAIRCALITHVSPGDSVTRMGGDIVAALEGLGVSTSFLCMRPDNIDIELVIRTLQSLQTFDGPKFLFDFNGKINLHLPHQGRQVSLLKEFKIPRLVQMIDHPAVHESFLGMDHHRTAWGVVAAHHVAAAEALSAGGTASFMPHGGPPVPNPTPLPPGERPIELLFCGNIRAGQPLAALLADLGMTDPAVVASIADAVAHHIEGGETLSRALTDRLTQRGLILDRASFARFYGSIEGWVVAERRRWLLENLPPDSALVLCGQVPNDIRLPTGTRIMGPIAFADFLDLVGNAKIVLNARTPFRDGAHERIFYGWSRGAAILTDASPYLAPDAAALPIAFYDSAPASVPEALDRLRARNSARGRDELAAEAAYYLKRHSWTTRMAAALHFMTAHQILTL